MTDDESELLIICDGFAIGRLSVPPFSVHRGEIVSLVWPLSPGHPLEAKLVAILLGIERNNSIQLTTPVVRAIAPRFDVHTFGSRWLSRFLSPLRPLAQKRECSTRYEMKHKDAYLPVTHEQEVQISKMLNLPPPVQLDSLSANDRQILALVWAWEEARAVIFDVCGCQPHVIYRVVTKKLLEGFGAIEISYPIENPVAPFSDSHPASRRIEIAGWEELVKNKFPSRGETKTVIQSLITGHCSREEASEWAISRIGCSLNREQRDPPREDRLHWNVLVGLSAATLRTNGEYHHSCSDYEVWSLRLDAARG